MSIGQKMFTSVILCAFLVGGAFMTYAIGKDVATGLATRSWRAVDCTISSSGILEQSPYRFKVVYDYVVDGRPYTGNIYYPGYAGSTDYYDAQKILDEFPAGAARTCFVNPLDAGQSSLEQRSIWIALEILFPLVFVTVGAGGMYLIWRKAPPPRPNVSLKHPLLIAGACGGAFFAFGAAMLAVLLPMLARGRAAQDWPQTPCVIASSGVQSHSGKRGTTTYSVAVLFHYTFNARKYGSSRYALNNTSTSDYSGQQSIVHSLPRGKKTVCYVNPSDPADAVMVRSYGMPAMLVGFLSLAFMLVGGMAIGATLLGARKAHRSAMEAHLSPGERKPADLKAANPAGLYCATAFVFALLWNGLMACAICAVVPQWHSPSLGTVPKLVAVALTICGIWLLARAMWMVRTLFYPRLRPHLSRHPLSPGQTEDMRWEIDGAYEQIQRLRLKVAGYLVNSNEIRTPPLEHKLPFWSLDLIDTTTPMEIGTGQCHFTIPPEAMPAQVAAGEKVVWAIIAEEHLFSGVEWRQDFPIHVS